MKESNLKMTNCPDEDISGDHLLAEARVSLVKIFPQMQKQFQVLVMMTTMKMMVMMMLMMLMLMMMIMMMVMGEEGGLMMITRFSH